MINIGSNKFDQVEIPLVFEDRYFLIEEQNGNDLWTVLTFADGNPVVEILRNEPQQNALSTASKNPTGIVTIADPNTGAFLYKLRPGSKNSSIFGSMNGQETEIKITDREIRIGTNVIQKSMIVGSPVGIKVGKNGTIDIGTKLPPEFQKLVRP